MDEVERKVGLVGLKMSGVVGGGYGGRVGALWVASRLWDGCEGCGGCMRAVGWP